MGTLFDQPPRDFLFVDAENLADSIELLQGAADRYGLAFRDIVELYRVLQYEREITAKIKDGDAKDEQLGGFGDILVDGFRQIAEALKKDD